MLFSTLNDDPNWLCAIRIAIFSCSFIPAKYAAMSSLSGRGYGISLYFTGVVINATNWLPGSIVEFPINFDSLVSTV